MKLIKKLTAVLLCICMAGVLGACGHLDMDAKPQETKNISIAQPAESTVIEDEADGGVAVPCTSNPLELG